MVRCTRSRQRGDSMLEHTEVARYEPIV